MYESERALIIPLLDLDKAYNIMWLDMNYGMFYMAVESKVGCWMQ